MKMEWIWNENGYEKNYRYALINFEKGHFKRSGKLPTHNCIFIDIKSEILIISKYVTKLSYRMEE